MSQDLTRLFLPPNTGIGFPLLMAGDCTAWDTVTSRSTVVVGGVASYTNLPVLTSAAATMGVGQVLLIMSAAGPVILGRLTVPV